MEELKQKAATQNFESAYVMYENATQGLQFSNEMKGDATEPRVNLNPNQSSTQSAANCIGFVHCHLDNGSTFKVFSLSDIIALSKVAKISTRPGSELVMYVVTASGTFAMKVNDKVALKNMSDYLELSQKATEPIFGKFVKTGGNIEKQTLGLLKFLKDRAINFINLYQQNTDINSPDYGKWAKLELNQT